MHEQIISFNEKLTYKGRINYIVSKAKSILAWIRRYLYEFDDLWTMCQVKCDLIRIESIQNTVFAVCTDFKIVTKSRDILSIKISQRISRNYSVNLSKQ